MKERKIQIEEQNKSLSKLLEDRGSAAFDSYRPSTQKKKGKSTGFIATKDESTYMLKLGKVELNNDNPNENNSLAADKRDLISEYITSFIYTRILKDRAPLIGLATKDQTSDVISIKSKYLTDYQSLKEYQYKAIRSLEALSEEKPLEENEIAFGIIQGKLYWKIKDNDPLPIQFIPDKQKNLLLHADLIKQIRKKERESYDLDSCYKDVFTQIQHNMEQDDNLKEAINLRVPKTFEIAGFEKIIASSLFVGEIDYHWENLGIATNKYNERYAVKIDHGRSGLDLHRHLNEYQVMSSFIADRHELGLDKISFSSERFKTAIEEIMTISEDEIENIITNRVYNLRKTGFKFNSEYYGAKIIGNEIIQAEDADKTNQIVLKKISKNNLQCKVKGKGAIIFENISDGKIICHQANKQDIEILNMSFDKLKSLLSNLPEIKDKSLYDTKDALLDFTSKIGYSENENTLRSNNIEKYYIEGLKKQKEIFKDLVDTMSIITKIDANEEFKNNQWLLEIYGGSSKKDPILFAQEKNFTIEGKNPILWALEKKIKIENTDPIEWATENKSLLKKLLPSEAKKKSFSNSFVEKVGGKSKRKKYFTENVEKKNNSFVEMLKEFSSFIKHHK